MTQTKHLCTIKVLCEQTRELTDDLHDFLDYVSCYLLLGNFVVDLSYL